MKPHNYFIKCPVPVKVTDIRAWLESKKTLPSIKDFRYADDFQFGGLFVGFGAQEAKKHRLPQQLILVAKGLPPHAQTAVFFHEWGHYLCWASDCKCDRFRNTTTAISESHADQFAIKKSLEYKLKTVLRDSLHHVAYNLTRSGFKDAYYRAAHITIDTPIWETAQRILQVKSQYKKGTQEWAEDMAIKLHY